MADGWIILDKESGLFSRTAGGRLARMFGAKTFGHIGTLDSMATGVLPIALGRATKMIPYVEDASPAIKEYEFSLRFGFETDTLDITGRQLRYDGFVPDMATVLAALPGFVGTYLQTPPAYSAVHIGGRRAYYLARHGAMVTPPARQVAIHSLEFLGRNGESWLFRTRCGRGTYVRSIARDIGEKCGAFATVDMIRRTLTNGFPVEHTVKLDFLENLFNNGGDIGQYLMNVDYGLGDIPVLNLNDEEAARYKCGGFIKTMHRKGLRRVYHGDCFIGIGYIDDELLRPKRLI